MAEEFEVNSIVDVRIVPRIVVLRRIQHEVYENVLEVEPGNEYENDERKKIEYSTNHFGLLLKKSRVGWFWKNKPIELQIDYIV